MEITDLHRRLALLLDPEKCTTIDSVQRLVDGLLDQRLYVDGIYRGPAMILVGGSTGTDSEWLVGQLKQNLSLPIILFPGNCNQFTPKADGILYLSLLSGTNPEYLVGQQIRSAKAIHDSGIQVIPTGYILIDGGVETSTMRVTHTQPLDPNNVDAIVNTAIAAQLMGKQIVYLEAGSGADNPVPEPVITAVKEHVTIPLIVGGGIRTPEAMRKAYDAGADIVVIGNHLEAHPDQLMQFCIL